MAVDMFLKIVGPEIKGEASDSKHADEINVKHWGWNLRNSGTMHLMKGGGAGKVTVGNVRITKPVDTASAELFMACCTGAHFEQAILTVRKSGGSKPVEYFRMTMDEVMITEVNHGGIDEERLHEDIEL